MKLSYKSTLAACYLGYITQAITVNLVTLFFVIFGDIYGVSYGEIGSLVLITFIVQILVDGLMVKFTYVIGYRCAAITAHVLAAAGLILLGILPRVMAPYPGILISVILYAIGGGITEVVISPIVDSLPGEAKASGMCLLHSFYSWGLVAVVAISTGLLKLFGDGLWYLIPMLWALIPLFNMLFFAKVPIDPIPAETRKTSVLSYFKRPYMYIAVVLMICGGASEMAMSQWASLFAEEGLGVTKVIGDLLGPCLFAITMGLGRTVYGIMGEKINIQKGLFLCSVLSVFCYLLTVFCPSPIPSLMGCAFCGLGVSLMWPGVLAMSSAHFGETSSPALFAFLALAGDVGCSVGPWLTGKVSDGYLSKVSTDAGAALRAGLLAAAVFPAVMLICTGILQIRKKRK